MSSAPMSTKDKQKAIQAIIGDASLSENEKRKKILQLNKRSTNNNPSPSNEQQPAATTTTTTAPYAAAATARTSPPDEDDMALAKARARKPPAAVATAAAAAVAPAIGLPQDAALAKARAQNVGGRATAPGVQAVGAAHAAAVGNEGEEEKQQEDPSLAKARAFGGGGGTATTEGREDPALAKMRAYGGGAAAAHAQGAAAAAKNDEDDEEESNDIGDDDDAALAKARSRKPAAAGTEMAAIPGANAVASNEYDATLAKARGQAQGQVGGSGAAAVASNSPSHQDSSTAALEKKLGAGGLDVQQPLLSQYQKEDAIKEGNAGDLKKSGEGSGRRLRKSGGPTSHDDSVSDIIDVEKEEALKKSLVQDSYYGDGYDAPIEATASPGYGVGSYLVQEQNASAVPQGPGDTVHVIHQESGTSEDVYANEYGGSGAVLAAETATAAEAAPALAAEAVTYAMDVKEIIPEAEVQKKEKRNIYRKWLVIAILTVCLVVPATVTFVVLGMSKHRKEAENGGATDEPPPTMAPTSANHQTYQSRLIELGISSEEDMANPLSAQNQALRWITTEDALGLDLETEESKFIQRYTMAALYYSTNGDSWAQCYKDDVQTHCMDGRKNVWLSDMSECEWAGVGCNGNGMVAMISILYPLNMNGPLPQEMASLQSLNDLSIVTQQISGPLPSWIGKLTNLLTLRLYENHMIGELPSSVYELPYLRNLVLRNNEFNGTISEDIGNMTSLIALHLSNNLLSGPIPSTVSNLSNLKEFYLYGNELNGTLPSSLYEMSNVEEIVLAYNLLSDELSPLVRNLESLKKLNLRNNQFKGDIPKELGYLLNLEQLDLVENNFVGEMPTELCYLRDFELEILAVDCSGETPEVICNCCTSCERRRQLLRPGFLR